MLLNGRVVHVLGQHEQGVALLKYPNPFRMQNALDVLGESNGVLQIVEAGDGGYDLGPALPAELLEKLFGSEKIRDGKNAIVVILPEFADGGVHSHERDVRRNGTSGALGLQAQIGL